MAIYQYCLNMAAKTDDLSRTSDIVGKSAILKFHMNI